MSLDYWSMKLGGVLVKYAGRFESIDDIIISDEDNYMDARQYPEDCLPHLGFYLSSGDTVGFEDFTIEFPADRWVSKNHSRYIYCVQGTRSLDRNYKLGPASGNLHLHSYRGGSGNTIHSYLNRCLEKPRYHSALESLLWDDKGASPKALTLMLDDTLISDNCATVVETFDTKAVYYKKIKVAVIQRSIIDDSQKVYMMSTYKGKVPAELEPLAQVAGLKLNIPDKGENLDDYFLNR